MSIPNPKMQKICASLVALPVILFAGAVAILPSPAAAHAADPQGKAVKPLKPADPPPVSLSKQMRVGESQVYSFNGISTAAVGDPNVAGVVPLSTGRLLINAKAPGRTTVY